MQKQKKLFVQVVLLLSCFSHEVIKIHFVVNNFERCEEVALCMLDNIINSAVIISALE